MEVRADEELVCINDGMELWPTTISLPAVSFYEQMIFRRVKQELRLHGSYEFFPSRELVTDLVMSQKILQSQP